MCSKTSSEKVAIGAVNIRRSCGSPSTSAEPAGNDHTQPLPSLSILFIGGELMRGILHREASSYHHTSPLFLFLSPVLYTTVPSAISSATVQVDEVGDIVTWQSPAQPNGVIQHYNIRISRVMQGVTERSYDLSALELSAGTYMIQVSSQLVLLYTSHKKVFRMKQAHVGMEP